MNAVSTRHESAIAESKLLAANVIAHVLYLRLPRVAMGELLDDIQDAVETRALNFALQGYLALMEVIVDQPALAPSRFTDERLDKRIRGLRELLVSIRGLVDIVTEDLADEDPIFERRLGERALRITTRLIERTSADLDLLVDERDERHARVMQRPKASHGQTDAFVNELETLMDDPWVTHAIAADKRFLGDADAEAASLRDRTQLPWHH